MAQAVSDSAGMQIHVRWTLALILHASVHSEGEKQDSKLMSYSQEAGSRKQELAAPKASVSSATWLHALCFLKLKTLHRSTLYWSFYLITSTLCLSFFLVTLSLPHGLGGPDRDCMRPANVMAASRASLRLLPNSLPHRQEGGQHIPLTRIISGDQEAIFSTHLEAFPRSSMQVFIAGKSQRAALVDLDIGQINASL